MTKRTTKHALLMSGLALLLCISMLIGSTYAWFTDSVTSTGNIIKSGTLDVTMMWKDATAAGAQQTYKDASAGPIFNYELWEPGYVEAKNLVIENVGSLALKYQLNIVATGEVSELAKVIDVYYTDSELTLADRTMTGLGYLGTLDTVLAQLSTTASGNLAANEKHNVTIALKMQESAGNEYQDKSIGSSFKVELMATQLTSEKDSFDDQYDKMATIDTIDELNEALAADYDLIRLGANLAPTESIVIPEGKTVAIDLAGYSIAQTKNDITAAYAVIENKGNLTIEDSVGTGKVSFTDATPYTAEIGWASNTIKNLGTLTVNGGTVENLTAKEVMDFSYPHAIDVYQGSLTTINGGTVKSLNYDSIRMFCNSDTLATKVVINGGTIINRVSFQDPHSTRPGYGILEINGGNFVTMNDVTANVRLLNFCQNCNNMKATVTGGTFDKGFKTQDIANVGVKTSDWLVMGTGVVVSNITELQAALSQGNDVVLIDDLTVTGSVITTNGVTEAYGNKVGAAQYGGTLDGNGNTLTETGSSAYVIVTHGGTIKNLTIVGGGRGIVIYAPTEDVIIDNVVIDGPGYAINTAEHNGQDLIVTNSTVNGWTSLAGLDSVSFTNCKLGENSTKCWQNYGYDADYDRLIRPYGTATFTGCTFEKNFYIDLSALANSNTVALTNCNCEGVVLTAENYANYITVELPDWANSIADCIVFN